MNSPTIAPRYVCSGWARQSGGVDGFKAPNVNGCQASFVAASGNWTVTFDNPVGDFNNLDFMFAPDLLSLSDGGGLTKSPVGAVPVSVTATGFTITFYGNDGSNITSASAGCYFTVYARTAR